MKRKITSLLILLVMVGFNVNAEVSPTFTDGLYEIKSVGTGRYMGPGTILTMGTDPVQVKIEANGVGTYNIISGTNVFATDGSKGIMIADKDDARALVTITAFGDAYNISSNAKFWNAQRNKDADNIGTQVGMGDSRTSTQYDWVITAYTPAPTVSITAPVENQNIVPGASVTLTASAEAEEGQALSSVEFFVDGSSVGIGSLNGEVYEYAWTAPTTEATYAITAKATSDASAEKVSDAVNVIVANLPTSIVLNTPVATGNVAEIDAAYTLSATATPTTGSTVSKVEFFEGANLLGEGSLEGGVYEYEWTPTVAAVYAITAKVTDSESGNATSDVANLNVKDALIKVVQIDFEDVDATDWFKEDANATLSIVDGKGVDGSKALAVNCDNTSTHHAYSTRVSDQVDVADGENVHIIASVATSDIAAGQPNLSFRADAWTGPTPGLAVLTGVANEEYTTKSFGRNANGLSDVSFSPRIRGKATVTNTVNYYDNMVLYAHSEGIDLVAPEAATEFSFTEAVPGAKVLSWTNGSDAKTYITKTVVLSSTSAEAVDAPVLNAQANYSVDDVVEDWKVVALLDTTELTYTDNSGTAERFAIVHRDLAYNYSTATVEDIVTGINGAKVATFTCVGTTGAVSMTALPLGASCAIYSVSGAKVVSTTIASSAMAVDLAQGVYIVRVADQVQKVVVK